VTADAASEPEVPIAHGDGQPRAYAECIRIARRLRTPGYAPVGLLPADAATVIAPIGIQLAATIVDVTGQASAFVESLARVRAQATSPTSTRGATRWLRTSVALVTPAREQAPCAQAAAACEAIEGALARFGHVVVDLTGFDRNGELAMVLASVRRVVIVASALETTERAVLDAVVRIPRPKRLGVMLIG
jgi:hypothetical protein